MTKHPRRINQETFVRNTPHVVWIVGAGKRKERTRRDQISYAASRLNAVLAFQSTLIGFDNATRIEKFRLAQGRSDQLKAGEGNIFPFDRNGYRQRGIPS